ncbi:MAG: ABC transporter substrate-binding protein [Bifidobacteriaceae bacterium]|jgi:oligopeptide transport system substrate-binding protein|nr:ABC transporter substrate-binding protein [Bifidobacteriaceae bacterium]
MKDQSYNNLKKASVLVSVIILFLGLNSVLSACSGGSNSNQIIRVYGCEPQMKLVPGNASETCGGTIVDTVFSGLVTYNKDGSIKNEIAESIVPDPDNKVYTIHLKNDWKFSDGEIINSDSFLKSWNYTALSTNRQSNQSFFDIIQGYDEVSDENPQVKILSGLQKVDDYTFKIVLKEPSITFPLRLGYSAFFPVPNSKFDTEGILDESYGEKPISNGPYIVESWQHDQIISLRLNSNYKGSYIPKNQGVDYIIYSDGAQAAYSDVQSGNLDLLEQIPSTQIRTFKNDESVNSFSEVSPLYRGIQIDKNLPHFAWDEEGILRREAISLSINRQEIINKIFADTANLPVAYVPNNELISGATDFVEGNQILEFNPQLAKNKWQEADKIKDFKNPEFNIYYNADSGEKAFFEAVSNSIKTSLNISSTAKSVPDKKTLLTMEQMHEVKGVYRNNWQPDYPSIENYLTPVFSTQAIDNGANYSAFSNEGFDNLLFEAATASSIDSANKIYQTAESLLFKFLPSIPTYVPDISAVSSKSLKGVAFNWKSVPEYTELYK